MDQRPSKPLFNGEGGGNDIRGELPEQKVALKIRNYFTVWRKRMLEH